MESESLALTNNNVVGNQLHSQTIPTNPTSSLQFYRPEEETEITQVARYSNPRHYEYKSTNKLTYSYGSVALLTGEAGAQFNFHNSLEFIFTAIINWLCCKK